MKINVTFDLDNSKRKVLQKFIGKTKGIRHQDYKEALLAYVNQQIEREDNPAPAQDY